MSHLGTETYRTEIGVKRENGSHTFRFQCFDATYYVLRDQEVYVLLKGVICDAFISSSYLEYVQAMDIRTEYTNVSNE